MTKGTGCSFDVCYSERGRKKINILNGHMVTNDLGSSKEYQLSRVVQDMYVQGCRFLSQYGSGLIKESDDLLSLFQNDALDALFCLIQYIYIKNTNKNVYLGNV